MTERTTRFAMTSAILAAAIGLSGCTTVRQTDPARSATEELIISSAIDRMVDRLQISIPKGTKVFVDNSFFDATDAKYAQGSIRERLLQSGAFLVADRKDADMVVETRSGAQSLDDSSFLIGVPQTPLPIPLAGTLTIPEIALFKRERRQGVAKAALTIYNAKTGEYRSATGAQYGYSRETDWTVLLLISWSNDDVTPDPDRPENQPYYKDKSWYDK
ncbi:MAG TPA: DUF6655 family protein [Magnetospirillaceae bacterium]|jgi:hypothetical protein